MAFNRTSLELKQRIAGSLNPGVSTFNRTSLELKLFFHKHEKKWTFSFNRTSLELKPNIMNGSSGYY